MYVGAHYPQLLNPAHKPETFKTIYYYYQLSS